MVDNKIFLDKWKVNKFILQSRRPWRTQVPQGIILRPLIFIIFNNDFPTKPVEGVSVLYTHDSTVTTSDEYPEKLKEKVQNNRLGDGQQDGLLGRENKTPCNRDFQTIEEQTWKQRNLNQH